MAENNVHSKLQKAFPEITALMPFIRFHAGFLCMLLARKEAK